MDLIPERNHLDMPKPIKTKSTLDINQPQSMRSTEDNKDNYLEFDYMIIGVAC